MSNRQPNPATVVTEAQRQNKRVTLLGSKLHLAPNLYTGNIFLVNSAKNQASN
jgi:hypothetical protein